MSGHTYTHDNYYNPRCAHAHRGLINTYLAFILALVVKVGYAYILTIQFQNSFMEFHGNRVYRQ